MASFATVDRLALYLGRPIDDDQNERALELLELATGQIQEEVGQALFAVEAEEVSLAGVPSRVLVLPEGPVSAVSAVVLGNGRTLDPSEYELLDHQALRLKAQQGTYPGPWATWEPGPVAVTYSHGFAPDEIPTQLEAVCLQVAARAYAFVDDTGHPIEGQMTGVLLTNDEKAALDRYRPLVVI